MSLNNAVRNNKFTKFNIWRNYRRRYNKKRTRRNNG